jgi:hypothetical protein
MGTNIIQDPMRFVFQLGYIVQGLAESFNWVYHVHRHCCRFCSSSKCKRRERAWIIGLTAIYFCIGVLLVILLNVTPGPPSSDEQSVLHRVARHCSPS